MIDYSASNLVIHFLFYSCFHQQANEDDPILMGENITIKLFLIANHTLNVCMHFFPWLRGLTFHKLKCTMQWTFKAISWLRNQNAQSGKEWRQGDTAASFLGGKKCPQQPESLKAGAWCLGLRVSLPQQGLSWRFSQWAGESMLCKWTTYLAVAGEAFVLFSSCCIKVFVFLSL